MKEKNKGSTVIETLVYIVILILLSGAVATALFALSRSYRLIQSSVLIENGAATALERIARDIRGGQSIDVPSSVFNSTPGVLVINSSDAGGNPLVIKFLVSSNVVRVYENGVDAGPLTSSKVRVTRLVFIPITTAKSSAIKMEMTLEAGEGANYKVKSFYNTVVMRGSYAH